MHGCALHKGWHGTDDFMELVQTHGQTKCLRTVRSSVRLTQGNPLCTTDAPLLTLHTAQPYTDVRSRKLNVGGYLTEISIRHPTTKLFSTPLKLLAFSSYASNT